MNIFNLINAEIKQVSEEGGAVHEEWKKAKDAIVAFQGWFNMIVHSKAQAEREEIDAGERFNQKQEKRYYGIGERTERIAEIKGGTKE